MRMTQKLRRFIAAAMLLLFATTTIISVLPPVTVHAEDYGWGDGITPYDQAKRWFYYRGMRSCMEGGLNNPTTVSDDKLNTGDFDAHFNGKEAFGFVARNLDGLEDQDGTVQCDDGSIWVGGAENFGFDSVLDMVCAINRAQAKLHFADEIIKPNGTDSNGNGDCEQSTQITFASGHGSEWQEALTRALSDEGSGLRPNFNIGDNKDYRVLMYIIGRESLLTFCGEKGDTRSFEDRLGNDTNDSNRVKVDVVDDSTGKIDQDRNYVIFGGRDENTKVDDVMYLTDSLQNEIGDGGGNNNEGDDLKCYEMARMTQGKYADAYSAFVKLHPDTYNGGGTTNGGGTPKDTCESSNGGFGWFGCLFLQVLDGVVDTLDKAISNLLFIDEDQYGNEGINNAWGIMRNIALLILVPMMMFMVIGTALEFGPFDAYTVKKALPRMMIAVIFIVLSFEITKFAVILSNSVGDGVGNIVQTAMRQAGTPIDSLQALFNGTDGNIFAGLSVGGAIVGVKIGTITWGLLGSLALVTIAALLIGAVILIIRQVLIILLMILAPLAILVWIFPGNDKLWKIWRTTFIAMLFMYPLIVLLIVAGRFFAGVVKASDPSLTLVNLLLMLVAYITPYFMIPAVFKYGLGVFGNLAGMINDRSRGFFDRQRKKRAETRAYHMEHASWGSRTRMAKKADIYRNLMSGSDKAKTPIGKYGRRIAARSLGHDVYARESAMNAAVAKEIDAIKDTGDDTEVRALTAIRDRTSSTGWRSLGGKEMADSAVMRARQRMGHDRYAQQAALAYEMSKADGEQIKPLAENFDQWASEMGMSDNEKEGAWVGGAFRNQGKHLALKHMKAVTGPDGKTRRQLTDNSAKALAREVFETRGSYPLSQQTSHIFEQLGRAYNTGDEETKRYVRGAAETFVQRFGSGDVNNFVEVDGEPVPVPGQGGQTTPRQSVQTSAQGAGKVGEAVRKLAVTAGVYVPRDPPTPPQH